MMDRRRGKLRPLTGSLAHLSRALLLATVSSLPYLAGGPVAAELWPLTRVRLKVIQWMPTTGTFQTWDAFSGEFLISSDGSMPLPVIGQIATLGKSTDEIAVEVAAAVKAHLGLVMVPDAVVEVVSYPPIYVVGEVSTPGSFEFRPGMSVLQGFAMAGGKRPGVGGAVADRLKLTSELHAADDALLRARARIARIRTEVDGAGTIVFPREVTGHPDVALAASAMTEERTILAAKQRELQRQAESLKELVTLLDQEIVTLQTRLGDVDLAIDAADKELVGVQRLVANGVATVSRQSDLEREITDLRFDRLSQTTAILRAQQALNQAKREAAQLEDARQTQGALALQDEQTKLEQLLLQQSTTQRLLLDLETNALADSGATAIVQYAIVRAGQNGPSEVPATEASSLQPGDVLKVTLGTLDAANAQQGSSDRLD
jgi:protein involved in polysaccharide export with SLBB domain